jgi:VWFA-related protein
MNLNVAAGAAVIAGLCTASGAGQQPVFRAGVTMVRVDVSVTRNGAPVSGLAAGNFEVRDNRVGQRIEAVLADDVPLCGFLVLDTSASVAGDKLADLRRAAKAFLSGLGPSDRAALLTFSHEVRLRHAPTSDIGAVDRALDRVEASGSTALNDAIYTALRLREPAGDRAVAVVFSDGLDNLSWLSDDEVAAAARRSDVIVYGVTLTSEGEQEPLFGSPQALERGHRENALLKRLGSDTGGRLWWTGASRDLPALFERALREIRARYVLTYYPTGVDDPGWHTLEVKLRGTRGDVTARPGYWAAAAR